MIDRDNWPLGVWNDEDDYERGKALLQYPYMMASPTGAPEFTFYEFFAGGGMARAGLGLKWKCLFANDFDFKKSTTYNDNWGTINSVLLTRDVSKVELKDLPGTPSLVWASFPCQDLSLAGMGAGLKGDRSGTFWPFWQLIKELSAQKRGPQIIVLENVCGTLTSHDGKDFKAIADALADAGYRFGAIVIDAVEFVPQSRPRLFIIAVAHGLTIPSKLLSDDASMLWYPKALQMARMRLDGKARKQWLWWKLPAPPRRETKLADLLEENPASVTWHTKEETDRLLAMMSLINREKVTVAQKSGQMLVGTIYRRTRFNSENKKVQRAEIRFDDVAGCLRTSSGGSSRQIVMIVKGDNVRSRLLSSREAARLMGLPDSYKLPKAYNEAYHLAGDGLVVPVVNYLASHILEPILVENHAEHAATETAGNPLRKAGDGGPLALRDTGHGKEQVNILVRVLHEPVWREKMKWRHAFKGSEIPSFDFEEVPKILWTDSGKHMKSDRGSPASLGRNASVKQSLPIQPEKLERKSGMLATLIKSVNAFLAEKG